MNDEMTAEQKRAFNDHNQLVNLVMVLSGEVTWVSFIPKMMASEYIRAWYKAKDDVCKDPFGESSAKARHWLKYGVMCFNERWPTLPPCPDCGKEDDGIMAFSAVAVESIKAMYIQSGASPQQYIAESFKRMVDEEIKRRREGEEWKGGDDNDD